MKTSRILPAAFAACVALPAAADPSYGIGVSYIFGGDFALGARIFSTDEPESAAFALGMDYKFRAGAIRPTAGVAYLDQDFYVDLSAGWDFGSSQMDFGIGVGGLGNMSSPAPAATPPATGGGGTTPATASSLSGVALKF